MRMIFFKRHSASSLLRSAFLSAMMIEVTAVNAQTLADLSLTKQVTPTIAAPGNLVTYTLTIHNLGPDSALPVVTDILPSGLTLISAPRCAETPPTVLTCTLGSSLAPDAEASITIVARVDNIPDGTLQNGANVADGSAADPDSSNNDATATLRVATPPIPSLGLTGLVLLALLLAALAIYRIRKFARTSDSPWVRHSQ